MCLNYNRRYANPCASLGHAKPLAGASRVGHAKLLGRAKPLAGASRVGRAKLLGRAKPLAGASRVGLAEGVTREKGLDPWQLRPGQLNPGQLNLGRVGSTALSVLLLLGMLLLGACGGSDDDQGAAGKGAAVQAVQASGIPVEVVVLKAEDFTLSRTYLGELHPYQRVRLFSEVEGIVGKLRFKRGDAVKAKDLLVRISGDRMRTQRDLAKVTHKLARNDYRRNLALRQRGVISTARLDGIKSKYDSARLNLNIAEINYQASIIRTPIAGYVSKRLVEPGELVRKGDQVAEILDVSKMKVVFPVPESDVRFFKAGATVTLTFDALPQISLPARVSFVSLEAGERDKNYRIEAEVENAQGQLRASMLARARTTLQSYVGQVLVPRHSVLEKKGRRVVFLEQRGKAIERTVITGVSWQGKVHVIKGLKAGERLVVTGHQRIRHDDALLPQIKQNTP